jgi:hypothetical protein
MKTGVRKVGWEVKYRRKEWVNFVTEIASVHKEQVQMKVRTLLSFATRHEGVWASGINFQAFLLSVLQPSPYRPLDTRPVWALRRNLKIFSLPHIIPPGVVQPTA